MAKKKSVGAPGVRGRMWVAVVLLAFVLVGAGVIQRRVIGIRQGQEIKALQDQLQAAQSRRVKLASDIEESKSLGRLKPIVQEKLGMRGPEETPTVLLKRTPR